MYVLDPVSLLFASLFAFILFYIIKCYDLLYQQWLHGDDTSDKGIQARRALEKKVLHDYYEQHGGAPHH
jgi:hypothetical protein